MIEVRSAELLPLHREVLGLDAKHLWSRFTVLKSRRKAPGIEVHSAKHKHKSAWAQGALRQVVSLKLASTIAWPTLGAGRKSGFTITPYENIGTTPNG